MNQPLLEVKDLSVRFYLSERTVHAVNGVSFSINPGEVVGLVGESGCGKTTLGRCVLRLTEPTYGRIVFDGRDMSPLSQRQLRPFRKHM
ncbi:MAG: ATP-binding cassette domain-containing protein, partial [Anaerolineae bacterium]|nr:ATP-binding cassette domain-containing protein [Anaerolineae bacterium]